VGVLVYFSHLIIFFFFNYSPIKFFL